MKNLPVCYPLDDTIPYLAHFAPTFSHVFVAFNPFLRAGKCGHQWDPECLPGDLWAAARRQGFTSAAGVSWAEVGLLSGLELPKRVNRALRLTGSKRIVSSLASSEDTQKLLQCCKINNICVPSEGEYSPALVLAIERFLSSLGHEKVVGARHFGIDPAEVEVRTLLEVVGASRPELHALDELYLHNYVY